MNLSNNIILKKGLQVRRETHFQRRQSSVLVEASDNKFTLTKPIIIRVTDSNQPILVNLFNNKNLHNESVRTN